MNPHIKILILNWNGSYLLKSCLDSVEKINYPKFSVMVIDNGSTDDSVEMVQDNFPQFDILKLDNNYGFARGYNRCFTQLKAEYKEYVLLLNNDTEVDPDILNSFIQAKEEYGENNLFGGRIFYHKSPERIWYAGGRINLKLLKISHNGIRQLGTKFTKPMQTDYITGCCLFTSIGVINQLNGFDEQFNMYGEDVDLCLRAKKEGINCFFWPDAKLWHHVSASVGGAFSFKKISKKYNSIIRLIKKHLMN